MIRGLELAYIESKLMHLVNRDVLMMERRLHTKQCQEFLSACG